MSFHGTNEPPSCLQTAPQESEHRGRPETLRWRLMRPFIALGIILTLPIVLPLILILTLIQARRTIRRYSGKVLLVWHGRRGWRDFCVNNVLPALPPGVEALHDVMPFDAHRDALRKLESRDGHLHFARPYLLTIRNKRVQILSLNAALQTHKPNAKRDPAVQREVAVLISSAVARLA